MTATERGRLWRQRNPQTARQQNRIQKATFKKVHDPTSPVQKLKRC
jgi:hypothetical protein